MEFQMMHPAEQICRIMERIYDMDMTSLTGGNISVMDEEGIMWVTPTSIDKKSLTRDDIVKVLPDGTIEGRHKPTSEYYIHRNILMKRPDIKAVIHAHAPAAVTLSVLNRVPETRLYQRAYETAGRPMLTPYALPGSLKLADIVTEAFEKGSDGAVLEKHSAFIGSRIGLLDCFYRFEALDFAARVEINSYVVGTPRPLSEKQLSENRLQSTEAMEEFCLARHTGEELMRRSVLSSILQRGYRKKLFGATSGTMSVRIGSDSFLIPKEGADNGTLTPEAITVVDRGRRQAGEVPERTAYLHWKIYERHPEIQAVIIAMPVHTMGFAVTQTEYETTLYPESYGVLCEARRYSFEEFYTNFEKIAENIDLQHPLAMIENYGVILAGAAPILAFDKLEVCESSAQSIHEMRRMGQGMVLMTEEQIKEMNG